MVQLRAERGTVIERIGYRLMRQLRSASAPTMPAPCKPKFISPDTAVVLTWRKVSLTAKLMVDPRNGARAVIRDTGSDGGRYLWNVLAAGDMHPISEGRTHDLARALPLAEAVLSAYAANRLAAHEAPFPTMSFSQASS